MTRLIAFVTVAIVSCDDPSCPRDTAEVNGECKSLDELNGSQSSGTGGDGAAATMSMQSGQTIASAGAGVSQSSPASGGSSAPSAAAGGSSGASASGASGSDAPAGASGGGAGGTSMMADGAAGDAGGAAQPPAAGSSGVGGMSAEPPACMPSSEVCDNADNDCDGKIDEAVTRSCGPNAVGLCVSGMETCDAGTWSECVGAVIPAEETCDPENLDENCDGAANEGCACAVGETRMCGDPDGECKQGTQTCVDGAWSMRCEGSVEPKTEVCDEAKLDEDCDGMPNDGCECVNGQTEMCSGNNTAPCTAGTRTCANGKWGTCSGVKAPQTEKCDGVDNDCNGTVDDGEDRLCTGSTRCAGREGCVSCLADQDCPAGSDDCKQGYCNLASNACETKSKPDRTRCSTGPTEGYCFRGECSECLSTEDCNSSEENECNRAVCMTGTCRTVITAGASCGSGKTCTADGSCQLPYYAQCESSDDCPEDAPCDGTSADGRKHCLPTCANNLMACDTHSAANGLCFYQKCLIQCSSCTVDELRMRTCTPTNSCPSGMPCLLTGDQMFCHSAI